MIRNRKPSAEILWRLATNVRRLREARGYSQLELTRRCGFNAGYVSKVENELKNVGLANLEALAGGLDCSVEDLFKPMKAYIDVPSSGGARAAWE